MNKIKTLVLMQLKDKIDLSWLKTTKDRIRVILLAIIKFLIITLFYTAILIVLNLLGFVYDSNFPQLMTFMLTIVLIMTTFSCTLDLTKSLYFSEDNKVLITLPVGNNTIFTSKLIVFMFYEIKRSLSFSVPIILGCMINIYLKNYLNGWSFLWMLLPLILFIILPVLLGALFSIPALYIYTFVSKYKFMKIILIFLGLGAYAGLVVWLTTFLPTEIDLVAQMNNDAIALATFFIKFERYNPIVTHITRIFIGELTMTTINGYPIEVFTVSGWTILKFVILLATCAGLFGLCYIISRPIFFKMMSKSFEFNKTNANTRLNKKHSKLMTFNLKEAKISFRTAEISLNYLFIYTTIPILIFLLNRLFIAMDKNTFGVYLSYGFNILVITFPLLITNGTIATLYSKEGRAGYIKKTKPVNPLMPLVAKLSFNLICCVPSIIASVLIFNSYAGVCYAATPTKMSPVYWYDCLILIIALVLLDYAHILYCAKTDIINPQNEVYATSGNDVSNKNEAKCASFGGILAILYSIFAFKLFSECVLTKTPITSVCISLMLISIALFAYILITFILSVKFLYAPNKE